MHICISHISEFIVCRGQGWGNWLMKLVWPVWTLPFSRSEYVFFGWKYNSTSPTTDCLTLGYSKVEVFVWLFNITGWIGNRDFLIVLWQTYFCPASPWPAQGPYLYAYTKRGIKSDVIAMTNAFVITERIPMPSRIPYQIPIQKEVLF